VRRHQDGTAGVSHAESGCCLGGRKEHDSCNLPWTHGPKALKTDEPDSIEVGHGSVRAPTTEEMGTAQPEGLDYIGCPLCS